jgi:hypothetical protein
MKSLDVGSVSLASSSTGLATHIVRYLFAAYDRSKRRSPCQFWMLQSIDASLM